MSQAKILKLLPAFEEKYLAPVVSRFGRQWTRTNKDKSLWRHPETGKTVTEFYDERNRFQLLKRVHLEEHFSAKPTYDKLFISRLKREVPVVWGSYGIALRFTAPSEHVKAICWDADTPYFMDLLHKYVIPWCDERKVPHVLEYSGYDSDKAHLWVPTAGVPLRITNQLFDQIYRDSGIEDKKEWFDEQYPYGARENSLIRLPFGLHGKHMDVFLGEYCGVPFESVEEGLSRMIEAPSITEEQILSFITEAPERDRRIYQAPERLVIQDAYELEPPISLPEVPRRLSEKCIAINRLIDQVAKEKGIEKRGGLPHNTGLLLSRIFEKHDQVHGGEEGHEAFLELISDYRSRSADDHNWDYYWGKDNNPMPWNCETMERIFDNCEGCPYRDRIRNPIQLYKAESILKEKVGETKLGSLDEIRAAVFPEVEKLIRGAIDNHRTLDLLIDSAPETGKSSFSDVLAAQLSREGKKVAIACYSVDVALEHQERIEKAGAKAFIMASFESLIEKFGLVCPNEQPIKDCRAVGIPSTYYKKKYCSDCPFYDKCPFPRQYKQVQEDKYPIVIIQHAHFACEETIRQLFKKHFDILIVDENFTDFLIDQMVPTKKELEILGEFKEKYDWVGALLQWIGEGGAPPVKIDPKRQHLTPIHKRFSEEKEPYRLPDFLRSYRNGDYYDLDVGLMKFIPIPDCNIRVILDATASMEELEIILNNDNIKSVGGEWIADPRAYHPDNTVYQILDGRASKSQMLKHEVMYEYLELIGDKMMNEYKDMTALITVFKEAEQDAWDWLIRNYPSIIPRIAVNHMAVGTNAWASFNVQFLLASVYTGAKQLKEAVYRLKFIINYWRLLEGKRPLPNPYPGDLSDDIGDRKVHKYIPVERDHTDGRYAYPQFTYRIPKEEEYYLEYLVFKRLLSKATQAIRVRLKERGKRTDVWVFNNQPLINKVVHRNFTEEEVLSQYREKGT